jgi:hypothetical protein
LQVQLRDGEWLSDFVMKFAGDVTVFDFLRLYQPAGKHLKFTTIAFARYQVAVHQLPAFKDTSEAVIL